jgi:hypothetical protein
MEEPGRFRDSTLVRIRQPDRTGGAVLPCGHEKGRDLRIWCKFCRPAFPSRVRDACGPRGSSEHTQRAAVSGGVRQLHTMMWSRRSRRQLPTQRSATPFCQGLSNEVRTGFTIRDRTAAGTSLPYLASRSKMTNLGADPNGNASRNCWTIHELVGCFYSGGRAAMSLIAKSARILANHKPGDQQNSLRTHFDAIT